MDRPYEHEPLAKLRTHYDGALATLVRAKHDLRMVTDELAARFADRYRATLHNQGRDHGEQTTEIDGFRLKMAVDKSVQWDQDSLQRLLVELPWDVARELITMQLSVKERTFNRITDDNLKGRIAGARTITIKPPQVTFAD